MGQRSRVHDGCPAWCPNVQNSMPSRSVQCHFQDKIVPAQSWQNRMRGCCAAALAPAAGESGTDACSSRARTAGSLPGSTFVSGGCQETRSSRVCRGLIRTGCAMTAAVDRVHSGLPAVSAQRTQGHSKLERRICNIVTDALFCCGPAPKLDETAACTGRLGSTACTAQLRAARQFCTITSVAPSAKIVRHARAVWLPWWQRFL